MAETSLSERFDVTIIGAGPGGYVAAIRAAQVGLKTAIIERDKDLGGTCLLRGCIPAKELRHSAHVYEPLKKNKITRFNGHGRLEGTGRVTVTSADGTGQDVPTKNVIIATGPAPRLLPGLQVQAPRIVMRDELPDFQHVPQSMVVLGAGAVGVEFAAVFQRFGTDVTILELLDRLVPIEDAETSAELQRVFRQRKINVLTHTKVESAQINAGHVEIRYTDAKGRSGKLPAETLLVAIGRPVTDGLGLETTKCAVEPGDIQVDEYTRTAEPNVYAIGDVVPMPWLAHVASKESCLAAEHIAGRNPQPI